MIIPTCFISSCLLYFGITSLQMELGAPWQRRRWWWGGTLESGAQRLAVEEELTEKAVLHFLSEHNSFPTKKSWEVGHVGMISCFFFSSSFYENYNWAKQQKSMLTLLMSLCFSYALGSVTKKKSVFSFCISSSGSSNAKEPRHNHHLFISL